MILPGRMTPRLRKAAIALVIVASMAAAFLWWVLAPIVQPAGATESPAAAVGISKVAGATWRPELGQPLFIAVLGTDVRNGPPGGGGGRCDAIHILAINPQQKAGTILNFPRDSAIAGYTKVNAACTGGVGPMVQALRSATGIPIQ